MYAGLIQPSAILRGKGQYGNEKAHLFRYTVAINRKGKYIFKKMKIYGFLKSHLRSYIFHLLLLLNEN